MKFRPSVSESVYALATVSPDLKSAISGSGPNQTRITLTAWSEALSDISDADIRSALTVALREHRERNITPAHFLGYLDQLRQSRSEAPTDAEIMADICDGRAHLPYHATMVDFGGWTPRHPGITEQAVRLLGGWNTIDKPNWHEPSARRTIREMMPALLKKQGLRHGVEASRVGEIEEMKK